MRRPNKSRHLVKIYSGCIGRKPASWFWRSSLEEYPRRSDHRTLSLGLSPRRSTINCSHLSRSRHGKGDHSTTGLVDTAQVYLSLRTRYHAARCGESRPCRDMGMYIYGHIRHNSGSLGWSRLLSMTSGRGNSLVRKGTCLQLTVWSKSSFPLASRTTSSASFIIRYLASLYRGNATAAVIWQQNGPSKLKYKRP